MSYTHDLRRTSSDKITFPCLVLCLLVLLIERVFPMVPDRVTPLYRPIFMAICLLAPSTRFYRLREMKYYFVILAYFTVVYLTHAATPENLNAFLSVFTFGLFLIIAGLRVWTEREIKWIICAIIIGSTIQSLVLIVSNNGLLHSAGTQHVTFLGKGINRNPCAFAVAMGGVCSAFCLTYVKKLNMFWVFSVVSFVICAYVVIALGCRSAFVSFMGGVLIVLWQGSGEKQHGAGRNRRRLVLIVGLVILFFIGTQMTEGTYSARLFSYSGQYDSGRHDIWARCWEQIKLKPVFGGGYDNFPPNWDIGTHNTFITWMLYGGAVVVAIWGLFFIHLIISTLNQRNLIPIAFLIETFMHCYTETDMDYYAYIPMIVSVILLNYLRYKNQNFSLIFTSRKATNYT